MSVVRHPPKELDDQIASLTEGKAIFCLRVFLLAGHVSEDTMQKAIQLAETLHYD